MDYQLIWFVLWGLLWAAYFATGGFDLGAGMLLPGLGKTEHEKEALLESFGPLWNGNEVWLVTAGGATFAAFPTAYAVLFSSFYIPLLLILFALIVRGVALEFREKLASQSWRKACDTAIVTGSVVPAFLFGVFFGNVFQGLPLDDRGTAGPFFSFSILTPSWQGFFSVSFSSPTAPSGSPTERRVICPCGRQPSLETTGPLLPWP